MQISTKFSLDKVRKLGYYGAAGVYTLNIVREIQGETPLPKKKKEVIGFNKKF